jgi:transposase
VVFNAEYSPWLNPVESLFGYLKRKVREVEVSTR